MKKQLFFYIAFFLASAIATAQRPTLTVLNIDSQGLNLSPEQMGNLVRVEVGKLDMFEVMDKYDVLYLVEQNKLSIQNCYGKICLVDVGKKIGADKMIGGSIERYGETIIMDLRLVDIATESIEKQIVKEFVNIPAQLQTMIGICIAKMFNQTVDQNVEDRLSQKNNFDNSINNPNVDKLNLSGPRMGFTVFTGSLAKTIEAPKAEGGYNALPVMFQFGYQFEAQYLNEGNYQALFEFIPMITGVDQNLLIPSLTILNGLRNNRNGWEFAIGPTVSATRIAEGFYDTADQWHRYDTDWEQYDPSYELLDRMDSRGDFKLKSGFVIAIGKSFKSGKLNIPLNAYMIPGKDSFRFGLSFGFNAKR